MGEISPVDILPAIVFPAQPSIAKQSKSTPFFKKEEYNELNTVRLSLFKKKLGDPGTIRTYDLLIRSQSLYPAELRGQVKKWYHTISL